PKEKIETQVEEQVEAKPKEKIETQVEEQVENKELKNDPVSATKISDIEEIDASIQSDKKILKTKSTKITEETIELTDPKAVAEALGLNKKKEKENEPKEIEEEIDIEALETGKKK
ncbi:MAG: hypothetical protein CMP36_01530, partial [Rickettsiales bacterium]